MRELRYSRDALRTLSRMPVNVADKIRGKLNAYAAEPAAFANNVKALRGYSGVLRMRVGDWRVLFSETGQIIAIIKIAPRGSAYD